MQQSFNCTRDNPIVVDVDKRKSTPREGLVSERLKQWKDNMAKQHNNQDTKNQRSPLVKRYNRTHFHSQPTTPTKQINEAKRRFRNPSNTSTNSDISSISDRSDFLKSPISSTDTSEARTSPTSERPQTCNSTSSQDSEGSTILDIPVKSQVTSIVINTRSPTKTVTSSYIVQRNDKPKIRRHSEGILTVSDSEVVKVKSNTPEPMIEHSGNSSPLNSEASSPTSSDPGAIVTTLTNKLPSTPPPVIKPKPKLYSKPEESCPKSPTRQSLVEPTVTQNNPPITAKNPSVESPITHSDPLPPPPPEDITPTSPQSYSPPPPPPPTRGDKTALSDSVTLSMEEKSISSYIQLNTLSDRIFKKNLRRGLEFTLLVVGEAGLGKTTLIDSLFDSDRCVSKYLPSVQQRSTQKTTQIEKFQVEIVQRGVNMKVNIIDTPGFGDAIDGTESYSPILNYINNQFERYYSDESGLNRKNMHDTRVHACLYFINPNGHGLRPLDLLVLKKLCGSVNIIPLIAKADTLCEEELISLKAKVRQELEENNIRVYDCTAGDDDLEEKERRQIQNLLPYSVIGGNTVISKNGISMIAREYPWGLVEIENPAHCDFTFLKSMLLRSHMSDLQETTHEQLYEEYRQNQLETNGTRTANNSQDSNESDEVDTMLLEKQIEIEKMKEQMLLLQQQLRISN